MEKVEKLEGIIQQAQTAGHDKTLRLFAVWCARQTGETGQEVLEMVEKYAAGESGYSKLKDNMVKLSEAAAAAGTIGLRIGDPRAAGLLATLSILAKDTVRAANGAANMHRRWAILTKRREQESLMEEILVERDVLDEQIRKLNEMLEETA